LPLARHHDAARTNLTLSFSSCANSRPHRAISRSTSFVLYCAQQIKRMARGGTNARAVGSLSRRSAVSMLVIAL
jgi:hypothetical protein